jgi:hypothetical protein
MPAFLVALIIYLFPKEVVAKMILVLFRRLAKSTEWTTIDDDLVAILERHLKEEAGE